MRATRAPFVPLLLVTALIPLGCSHDENAYTRPGIQTSAAPASSSSLGVEREAAVRERYQPFEDHREARVLERPVSTFSVDVDTGAYANVRRMLEAGSMPPRDAVRVEEFINYFPYDYPAPRRLDRPFSVTADVTPTPWNRETFLMRIGIKGYEVEREQRPAANLVFLVDVSGSMASADKLPLLVRSLKMLAAELTNRDRIALVVYAGSTGVVLEPTPGDLKDRIFRALDGLKAGGSTAGGAGLALAYRMAGRGWIEGGINRVILATDGDFNVGVSDVEALTRMIEEKRDSGIALTTLGFGTGNYNEHLMEQLANVGNGNYAYIDRLSEARKVLVESLDATLLTIAKDVKVQVEFNPAVISSYRLIGYENRALKPRDFGDDRVDAGEIGAGHAVTALYEVRLAVHGRAWSEPLRYRDAWKTVIWEPMHPVSAEFAFVALRYKSPEGGPSRVIEQPLSAALLHEVGDWNSVDLRFAAAVAAFGQVLRGGGLEGFHYDDIVELARSALGEDREGYRAGFVDLVQVAASLDDR